MSAFKFDEPGSRILREWNARRAQERLIAERGRKQMRSPWWGALTGQGGGSGFAGGSVSRLTASLSQWSGALNADLDASLVIMRARARQLCQNNEFGRRFLSLVSANVVGPSGPTLQVRAYTDGAKPVLDKAANDVVETHYAQWCKHADVRGVMDWAQMQRVGVAAAARDGEALIRVVRGKSLHNGIALQMLEADRLDESINTTLSNGNFVRQGVEVNSLMQPVAYYIKAAHPGENRQATPPVVERIPAAEVIHAYLPTRAEQVRGYTWLHAVLLRMQMLHDFEEAAVVAARVGASKMGVFAAREGADPKALAMLQDGFAADGTPQMNAEPGEFMKLPEGWELQSWNPEYPHANFDSFLKACFRGVAVGVNVAAHNLTGDMTDVNYSSARIAELQERDQWEVLQNWWLRAVVMPIYEAWLESAMIRGDIRFPESGKALPWDKIPKFARASHFQARRWKWVDPSKEMDGLEREVALGINSRTRIAASQGREFEDIIDELKQEKELLKAAGLSTAVGKTTPAAPEPVPEPKEGT